MSVHLPIYHCARIVVEARTPIVVSSGGKSDHTDATLQRDHNGLPFIPGTSLAGVLRHAWEREKASSQSIPATAIFGFQDGDAGEGSRLNVSDGLCVGPQGEVIEGLIDLASFEKEEDASVLVALRAPYIRQHVRLGHAGVADDHGKFDREIALAGTRYAFALTLRSAELDDPVWPALLALLHSPLLRVGSGTRSGSGRLEVIRAQRRSFDLRVQADREAYLGTSAALSVQPKGWSKIRFEAPPPVGAGVFELNLQPESTFFFGSGFGDEESDDLPVEELRLHWRGDRPVVEPAELLIPASSIKGALAHRVSYHYNRLCGVFADQCSPQEFEKHLGANNAAVRELFGEIAGNRGRRGRVLIDDLYVRKEKVAEKLFNHVAIDRFAGGALDGALYSERVLAAAKPEEFALNLTIAVEDWDAIEPKIRASMRAAVEDLRDGRLPLGGHSLRGHGIFVQDPKVPAKFPEERP
jgi:CRISPR/Cas system CSM-associated protein Csm3 (group 7 of RAMP superfamily)